MNDIEQRIADLEQQLEAAKAERDNVWPKEDDDYWYINGHGRINKTRWHHSSADVGSKHIGNIFRKSEEAEARVKYLKAVTKLRSLVPDNWKPDWSDDYEMRHFIMYNNAKNKFYVHQYQLVDWIGPIYFPSEESAQSALEAMGDQMNDLLKGGF